MFLGMTVVPVSVLVSVCTFVRVCCVRKEMLFHSVISKQGIFLILDFQSQQSQLTLETDPRLLWRKILLWYRLLYLRGLELLLFQCCFYLHEFTQWVVGAHRKISHIGSISCNVVMSLSPKTIIAAKKYLWWPFATAGGNGLLTVATQITNSHWHCWSKPQAMVCAQQLALPQRGWTKDLRAVVYKHHHPIPANVWKSCLDAISLNPFCQSKSFCKNQAFARWSVL